MNEPVSPSQPRLSQRLEWAAEAETLLRRQELVSCGKYIKCNWVTLRILLTKSQTIFVNLMFQKLLYFDQVRESELGDGEELRKAFEKCKMSRQTTNKLSRELI